MWAFVESGTTVHKTAHVNTHYGHYTWTSHSILEVGKGWSKCVKCSGNGPSRKWDSSQEYDIVSGEKGCDVQVKKHLSVSLPSFLSAVILGSPGCQQPWMQIKRDISLVPGAVPMSRACSICTNICPHCTVWLYLQNYACVLIRPVVLCIHAGETWGLIFKNHASSSVNLLGKRVVPSCLDRFADTMCLQISFYTQKCKTNGVFSHLIFLGQVCLKIK